MTLTTDAPVVEEERVTPRRQYGPDVVVVTTLVVVAFVVRLHGLPTDGLWLDDSVTAAGVKASVWHLLTVGFDHPGFTAWLMVWRQLTGGSDTAVAVPALIGGTLAPGALYLVLRRLGYARSIAALLGAALVACQTDIVYSGRVKNYTLDVLVVLGYTLVVPRLARMRWRWQAGLVWVVAAISVASLSSFSLVASAVAGVILVLHPAGDLRARIPAVGTQLAAHVFFVFAGFGGRFSYDAGTLTSEWRRTWDAFVNFDPNPLRFADDALRHLVRVAEVFPGGPTWFATLCALAALLGLGFTAWRGRQALRARYLVLILAVTFVGSVAGKFPFGPKQANPFSSGGRVSIWLAPVIALGLAAVLHGARRLLVEPRRLRVGYDAAVFSAVGVVLVFALGAKQLPYPFSGAHSAAGYVQSHLGPHDVALIPWPDSAYSFAAESDFGARMEPQPVFTDPRLRSPRSPTQVARAVLGAERVFVYLSDPQEVAAQSQPGAVLGSTLGDLGFGPRIFRFDDAQVEVWQRDLSPAHELNLRLSDLPPGWHRAPVATAYSSGLFACLDAPTSTVGQSAVDVMGPSAPSQMVAQSEITTWSSAATAQGVFSLLNGPRAPGCLQSTLTSALLSAGYPTSVTVRPAPPPPAGNLPVVSFTETVQATKQKAQIAQGTMVYFIHGTTGVLFNSLSVGQQPFPGSLLSGLVTTLAARVSA